MANGEEDLHEKNKDKDPVPLRYDQWRVTQGREDAEMLAEKSSGWSSKKANRGDYDSWDDD